jgi:L-alanine-DL-glutamate epimerase-like enolase superfamily enzyme
LADLGILYVEEPLPIELIPERATLREATILPLIADDSVFTPRDLTRELRYNTFDILNIKTARTGYTQSLQMLSAARQHGKGVMVGSQASSTLGTIRAAIFAGLEGIDYPCELSFFLKLEDEIVNRPITLTEGYLDLDMLREITVDEARLRACQ